MAEVSSKFLTVSHLTGGQRIPGFLAPWAAQCDRCDRQCESSVVSGLGLCSYGVNFQRLSDDTLLFGFLVQGAQTTQAQRKALKGNPQSVIKPELYRKTIDILTSEKEAFNASKAVAFKAIVEEYRSAEMFKPELLEVLKPEIKKSLAFLHDYKQFVSRVKQNINVVLQNHFPNESVELQLQKATKAEAAIYWSAALMDDKLKTALLLTQPERLATAERTQFRLHGFIFKHMQIYDAAFKEKGIVVVQTGHSVGQITAPQAFAAIPHTLLDNALKYSSRDCQVTIGFKEDSNTIEFSVTSFGPKIETHEASKIFELFQRGAAGAAQEEEGSGIGLYLAQLVAKGLGTEIRLRQSGQKMKCGYETVFSVVLSRTA